MSTEATEVDVKAWVTEYYGKILKESKDLKTNACCASGAPPKPIRKLLKNLHPEVLAKFYGMDVDSHLAMDWRHDYDKTHSLREYSSDTKFYFRAAPLSILDVGQVVMSTFLAN